LSLYLICFEGAERPNRNKFFLKAIEMWFAIKRLILGIVLIVLAAGLLLFSDWKDRSPRLRPMPRIAILQHSSQPLLDEGVEGMLQALKDNGFIDGQTIAITKYNAENDIPTGNAIAKEITDGRFDLVLTASTLSMQAVANANKAGKTIHVFGLVADPFVAGVGLKREDPLDHPGHLVGIGTFMPVADGFRLARRLFPGLSSVGVVWNPGEANSRAFTLKAREVCGELGIKLVETNVDNSSGIFEAATSLVSRGVQALWVGGDVTVLAAIDSVITAANKGRIPVFTITPPSARRGALFDMGANFFEVGRDTGKLAAQILNGADPSTIPIRDYVPKKLMVNKLALNGLRDPWTLPEDIIAGADVVIDETGVHEKTTSARQVSQARLIRKWKVRLVEYVNVLDVEEARKGVMDGLREAGLVEGRDYEVKILNAQGDMATVNSLIDSAVSEGADLLITLSTPTLQAALQRARNLPIVFTYVASPVAAGAGRSDEDHLPNVTGVYVAGAYEEMLQIIRECIPSARVLGTLFVPSEVNTVFHKDKTAEAAQKLGMELVAVAANTSSEVADAAVALCSRKLDAVCQIGGNLTASSFPSIAQAAKRARLPVFAFLSSLAKQGASVVVSRDYADGGREAALMAARVMRGESPAKIPFQPVKKTRLIVNLEAARDCGLKLPQSLIKRADEVIGQ